MSLGPRTWLGPYEVTAKIGQGGRGEVYRAHDMKLDWDVALKVLPDLFADDPERLARFQREAQVLASLNHHFSQSPEIKLSHVWRPLSGEADQRAGGVGNVSRRVGFGVVVACLSILSVLDAPVSGQSAPPAADEQATVRLEAASTEPSVEVVVLPFANISREPGDDWIGAGIAATLETELHQVSGVQVISRASLGAGSEQRGAARSNRSPDQPLEHHRLLELGRQGGVAWLVTGGYQRVGEQLRITVRLIEVATGTLVHTVKVDGTLNDLFALQDRVAAQVGRALNGDEAGVTVAGAAATEPALATRAAARPAAPEPSLGTQVAARPDDLPRPPGRTAASSGVAGRAAFSDPAEPAAAAKVGKVLRAFRITGSSPQIDGRLNDEVWAVTDAIDDFVQEEPDNMAPPTERMVVQVAYDDWDTPDWFL